MNENTNYSNTRNPIDTEEYYITAKLDLSEQPTGTLYFNRDNNFEYQQNWFNYNNFHCVSNDAIVGDVIQSSSPKLINNTIDTDKTFVLPYFNQDIINTRSFACSMGTSFQIPFPIQQPSTFYPTTWNFTVGSSPSDDFKDLQTAIATVPAGSSILVKLYGFVVPVGGININKSLTIFSNPALSKPIIFVPYSPITISASNVFFGGFEIWCLYLDFINYENSCGVKIYNPITPPSNVMLDNCSFILQSSLSCINICASNFQISNCNFLTYYVTSVPFYIPIVCINVSRNTGNSFIYKCRYNSMGTYFPDSSYQYQRVVNILLTKFFLGNSVNEYYQDTLYILENISQFCYQLLGQTNFSGPLDSFTLYFGSNASYPELDALFYFYSTSNYFGDIFKRIVVIQNACRNYQGKGILSVDSYSDTPFPLTKYFFRTNPLTIYSVYNFVFYDAWLLQSGQKPSLSIYGFTRNLEYWTSTVTNNDEYTLGYNSSCIYPVYLNIIQLYPDINPSDICMDGYYPYMIQSGSYNTTNMNVYNIQPSTTSFPSIDSTLTITGTSNGFLIYYYSDPNITTYTYQFYIFKSLTASSFVKICGSKFTQELFTIYDSSIPMFISGTLTYVVGYYETDACITDYSGTTLQTFPTVSKSTVFITCIFSQYNTPLWTVFIDGIYCVIGKMSLDTDNNNVYLFFMYKSTNQVIFYNKDGSTTIPNLPSFPSISGYFLGIVKYDYNGIAQWATYIKGDLQIQSLNNMVVDKNGKYLYISGSYTNCVALYNASSLSTPNEFSLPTPSKYSWLKRQPGYYTPAFVPDSNIYSICTDGISGSNIGLLGSNGTIWLSVNSGISWNPQNVFFGEQLLKIRSNKYLSRLIVAVKHNQFIYELFYAVIEWYGITWYPAVNDNQSWSSVSMDSSGYNMIACSSGGKIYWCNWALNPTFVASNSPNLIWTDVCIVENPVSYILPSKAVACAIGYPIYKSDDTGQTWYPLVNSPSLNWSCITCDDNCQNIYVGVLGFYIYKSSDGGITWTKQNSGIETWNHICCNSTGQYVAATVQNGQIWVSSDFGVTWEPTEQPRNWSDITCIRYSENPLKLFIASTYNGNVYYPYNIKNSNSFIIKYDASQGSVIWTNYLDGGYNFITNICLNNNQQLLYIGGSYSVDINIYNQTDKSIPKTILVKLLNNATFDNFIIKYNSTDGSSLWNTKLSYDYDFIVWIPPTINSLTVDYNDNLYISGSFTYNLRIFSPNFPNYISIIPNVTTDGGYSQMYIVVLYPDGNTQTKPITSQDGNIVGTNVLLIPSLKGNYNTPPTFGTALYSYKFFVTGTYTILYSSMVINGSSSYYAFIPSLNLVALNQNCFLVPMFINYNSSPLNPYPYLPYYNDPSKPNYPIFNTQLTLGGCSRELIPPNYVDTPIECWGGITGWTASSVSVQDINTGVICKYGHDMGNTRIFINGLPGTSTKYYAHLVLGLTEPSFPPNDPQPITTTSIPYGFLLFYIRVPYLAGCIGSNVFMFNNSLNNYENLTLTPLGGCQVNNQYIQGINIGDIIRIAATSSSGTYYINLTVKDMTASVYDGINPTSNPTIIFEENTLYANNIWKSTAYVYGIPIVNPITDSTYYYLSCWIQPSLIHSGTINTILQIIPKEYIV